jgi:hypothetical protein
MKDNKDSQHEARGYVCTANPWPDQIGTCIIEPECRHDQQSVKGHHGATGEPVFPCAPAAADVYRN